MTRDYEKELVGLRKQERIGDGMMVGGGIAGLTFMALFLFTTLSERAAGLPAEAFWVSMGLSFLGVAFLGVGLLMSNRAETDMDLLAWDEWQEQRKP